MIAPARFGWRQTQEALAEALASWDGPTPRADERGRRFLAEGAQGRFEVRIPLVLDLPGEDEALEDWLARATGPPGRQLVILVQAGACALGLFEEGELVLHRTLKRYVVRGKGRAQPGYLKTKGKSRYGSRLRLRNAMRLLEETAETLREWVEDRGAFDRVFQSCPPRTWAELLREDLPFDDDDPVVKIPMDLKRPSHEEMLRAFRALSHGSWMVSA